MEDNSEQHEEVMRKLEEIRGVLIGTYEKKGIISRLATVEKYVAVVGMISMSAITGVIGRVIFLTVS